MTTAEILAKATPRPWVRGVTKSGVVVDGIGSVALAEPDRSLVLIAVNSYEADQERIAKLESLLRRIALNTHEPDKWPMEFSEFAPRTASALQLARKRAVEADQELIGKLTEAVESLLSQADIADRDDHACDCTMPEEECEYCSARALVKLARERAK